MSSNYYRRNHKKFTQVEPGMVLLAPSYYGKNVMFMVDGIKAIHGRNAVLLSPVGNIDAYTVNVQYDFKTLGHFMCWESNICYRQGPVNGWATVDGLSALAAIGELEEVKD